MIERTTLVSESGSRWIDSKGRSLVSMGHAPLYQGKQVWTDGVVIYGYPLAGNTFTDPPKKKKENKAGIVYYESILRDLTDLTAEIKYYKPHGTQLSEYINLLRKSADWELAGYEYSTIPEQWFAGDNVVFWGYDTTDGTDYYFIADAGGGSAYLPYTQSDPLHVAPSFLDLDLDGNSAWFVGEIHNTYNDKDLRGFLFYADRGFNTTSYLQLGLVRQAIQQEVYNNLPHTPEADGRVSTTKWVRYYGHATTGAETDATDDYRDCANGYIINGVYNCDMCVRVSGYILYTPADRDQYTEDFNYYYDIHISGTNYTYQLHQEYTPVQVGDYGIYDGETETMTVTYEVDNVEYTSTIQDIPPSTKVQRIGNSVYVYSPNMRPSSGLYGGYFMYVCHDGIVEELKEPYEVTASRLEYKTDVTEYGKEWSPEEQQGQQEQP